ncbi:MAG: 50S ribosomal protein L11 methyltransferase [Pseudomonadota bacterium]
MSEHLTGQTITRFSGLSKDKAERLAALLGEDLVFETQAVSLEEITPNAWQVEVYTATEPSNADIEALFSIGDLGTLAFTSEPVPQMDWVLEGLKTLQPVEAGRFVVLGSHSSPAEYPGKLPIIVDAGVAFGTGHHGTTAGCLVALSDLAKRGYRASNILDVGTGSGVLAIGAQKLFRAPAMGTDVDAPSVETALENAKRNGVGPEFRGICTGSPADRKVSECGPFDLVFANILAKPLIWLAPDIALVAGRSCHLIVSGLLPPQTGPVRVAYGRRGFGLKKRYQLNGWSTLVFQKTN